MYQKMQQFYNESNNSHFFGKKVKNEKSCRQEKTNKKLL